MLVAAPEQPSSFLPAAVVAAALTGFVSLVIWYATDRSAARKRQEENRTKQLEALDRLLQAATLYANAVIDLAIENHSAWENADTPSEHDDTDYDKIKRLTNSLPDREESLVKASISFGTLIPPELLDKEFDHFQSRMQGLERVMRNDNTFYQWAPGILYPKLSRYHANQSKLLRDYDHVPPPFWMGWKKASKPQLAPVERLPMSAADPKAHAEGDKLLASLGNVEPTGGEQ